MDKLKTGGLLYMLTIAYRNIYRNKRRTILCMVAVGISVFVIVLMMGFVNGMIESSVKTIQTFETGHVQIGTKDFYTKSDFKPVFYPVEVDGDLNKFMEDISNIKGVSFVTPRIASFASFVESKVKHGVIWGIDTEKEFINNKFNLKNKNDGLIEGRYPTKDENGCAIGERLAIKMGLKIGDKIQMKVTSSQFSDKFFNPTIVGIFDYDYIATDENYVIVPFERLQRVLTLRNKTQEIIVYLNDYNKSLEVKKEIQKLVKNENIAVKGWNEHHYLAMLEQMTIMFVIIYLVFIVVSSFLIINTVLMMIHERIKEIGMMGSLGMTRGEIVKVIFFEAVFLSIFGSLFGAFVGGVLNLIISNYPIDLVSMSGGMDMPMGNTLFLKSSFEFIFKGFLFGVVVSSICTIIPSLKAAFIAPVEALRR